MKRMINGHFTRLFLDSALVYKINSTQASSIIVKETDKLLLN